MLDFILVAIAIAAIAAIYAFRAPLKAWLDATVANFKAHPPLPPTELPPTVPTDKSGEPPKP